MHAPFQRVLACNTAEQRGEEKEEEGKGQSPEMLVHRAWDVRGCSRVDFAQSIAAYCVCSGCHQLAWMDGSPECQPSWSPHGCVQEEGASL